MEISFWTATDAGRVREINEDNFLVDKALSLFVVCDGMGGHAAGEVASSAAARILRDVVAANREIIDRCRQDPSARHRQDVLTLLEFAVRDACARIHRMAAADAARRGMGTTLSALVLCGQRAFVAHVGDSRVYLLRAGQVHQLTEDHTLVNELVKRGRLSEAEVAELPIKNAVTRAVGVYETVDVDTHTLSVLPQDRFLVCSDGLHNYLPDEASVLPLLGAPDAPAIARRAIEFANRCGGKDNITALVVELGADEAQGEQHSRRFRAAMAALRESRLFSGLDDRALDSLLDLAARRVLRVGERLLLSGAGGELAVCVVQSGALRAQCAGRSLGVLEARACAGVRGLFVATGHEPALELVATTTSEALVLPRRELLALFAAQPELAARVLWNAARTLARSASSEPLELAGDLDASALASPWDPPAAGEHDTVAEMEASTAPFSRSETTRPDLTDLTHEVELLEVQGALESGEFLDPDELLEDDDAPTPAGEQPAVEPAAAAPQASPRVQRPRTQPLTPINRQRSASDPGIGGYRRRDTVEAAPSFEVPAARPVVRPATPPASPPGPQQPQQGAALSASERFARLRSMLEPTPAAGAPAASSDPLDHAVDDLQRRYAQRLGRGHGRTPAAARHDQNPEHDTRLDGGAPATDEVHEQTVRTPSPYYRRNEDR